MRRCCVVLHPSSSCCSTVLREVSARQLGLARREASWHRGQPALHLAQADGAGRADRRRRRRGGASELRAAHQQIRELQRLLGKKTLENEILREAVERVTAPKKLPLRVTSWPGDGR